MLRIAHGGASIVIAPLVLGILAISLSGPMGLPWLATTSPVFLFLFMAFMTFFRDPERRIGQGIVSGADGKVIGVDQVEDEDLGPCDRMKVFMRVHDVHVNRFPFDADVRRIDHFPGKHLPAYSKDSERNERVVYLLRTTHGPVKVVQIAGAVARRIVPYATIGVHATKGHRLGLIRFGSRFDIVVPQGKVTWAVEEKQRVFAGSSRVGDWKEDP